MRSFLSWPLVRRPSRPRPAAAWTRPPKPSTDANAVDAAWSSPPAAAADKLIAKARSA